MINWFLGIENIQLSSNHIVTDATKQKIKARNTGGAKPLFDKTPEEMKDIKFRERVTTIERFIEGLKRGEFISGVGKPVICTTTNEFFASINLASEKYNVHYTNINYAAKTGVYRGKLADGTPLYWRYATPEEALQHKDEYL